MALLEVNELKKAFYDPEGNQAACVYVSGLTMQEGERMVLEGPSGSGKTTFLHLLSGMLTPDSGSIYFDGRDVLQMPRHKRDCWRADNIGYVFQKLNLLEALTVEQNVLLARMWSTGKEEEPEKRVHELLEQVGLEKKAKMLPHKLSLGEQQRVAVVRALFNRPKLLLADEPTASLDRQNAETVLQMMTEMCRQDGVAMLLSTHDDEIKKRFENRYDIRSGVRYE